MSKWIRGRFMRPTASIITVLLLAGLLVPLAGATVYAQTTTGGGDALSLTNGTAPTRIVVLSFGNTSGHSTGLPGEEFSKALALELTLTRVFEVAKETELASLATLNNVTPPYPVSTVAVVATQLQCNYGVTGSVESVKVYKDRNGTYAEVVVSALLVSRILGVPIAGARIVQKSAPRKTYSGNPDDLVHEAITLASYEVAQRILTTRFPLYLVSNSNRNGEVIIKPGGISGLQVGTELITLRSETVTGRVRITHVEAEEAVAVPIYGNRGIARGDKAIPVFDLGARHDDTKENVETAGKKLGGWLAFAGLLGLIGSGWGTPSANTPGLAAAAPLADAGFNNEPNGANVVRMPSPNSQDIAWIIYRDDNLAAPVAVIEPPMSYFLDSAKPLPELNSVMESTTYTFQLNELSALVDPSSPIVIYDMDLLQRGNGAITLTKTLFSVTSRRVPPTAGTTYAYQVQPLYYGYDQYNLDDSDPTAPHPQKYRFFLGSKSPLTGRVPLSPAPRLEATGEFGPVSGNYRASKVPGATSYLLQVSTDATFPKDARTISRTAAAGTTYVQGTVSLSEMTQPGSPFAAATVVYWRIGARVDGGPLPQALSAPNDNGWVFPTSLSHKLTASPPRGMGVRSIGAPGSGLPRPTMPGLPAGRLLRP